VIATATTAVVLTRQCRPLQGCTGHGCTWGAQDHSGPRTTRQGWAGLWWGPSTGRQSGHQHPATAGGVGGNGSSSSSSKQQSVWAVHEARCCHTCTNCMFVAASLYEARCSCRKAVVPAVPGCAPFRSCPRRSGVPQCGCRVSWRCPRYGQSWCCLAWRQWWPCSHSCWRSWTQGPGHTCSRACSRGCRKQGQ
jgi:hypothetical protein